MYCWIFDSRITVRAVYFTYTEDSKAHFQIKYLCTRSYIEKQITETLPCLYSLVQCMHTVWFLYLEIIIKYFMSITALLKSRFFFLKKSRHAFAFWACCFVHFLNGLAAYHEGTVQVNTKWYFSFLLFIVMMLLFQKPLTCGLYHSFISSSCSSRLSEPSITPNYMQKWVQNSSDLLFSHTCTAPTTKHAFCAIKGAEGGKT